MATYAVVERCEILAQFDKLDKAFKYLSDHLSEKRESKEYYGHYYIMEINRYVPMLFGTQVTIEEA